MSQLVFALLVVFQELVVWHCNAEHIASVWGGGSDLGYYLMNVTWPHAQSGSWTGSLVVDTGRSGLIVSCQTPNSLSLVDSHFAPTVACPITEVTKEGTYCGAVHTDIERLPGIDGFIVRGKLSLFEPHEETVTTSFWCSSDIPAGMPTKGIIGLAPALTSTGISPATTDSILTALQGSDGQSSNNKNSDNAFLLVLSNIHGKLVWGTFDTVSKAWLPSHQGSVGWLPLIDQVQRNQSGYYVEFVGASVGAPEAEPNENSSKNSKEPLKIKEEEIQFSYWGALVSKGDTMTDTPIPKPKVCSLDTGSSFTWIDRRTIELLRREFLSFCARSADHCVGSYTSNADLNSLICLSWQSEQSMRESMMSLPNLVFHLGTKDETMPNGNEPSFVELVVKPSRYLFELPERTFSARQVTRCVGVFELSETDNSGIASTILGANVLGHHQLLLDPTRARVRIGRLLSEATASQPNSTDSNESINKSENIDDKDTKNDGYIEDVVTEETSVLGLMGLVSGLVALGAFVGMVSGMRRSQAYQPVETESGVELGQVEASLNS